jgi:hypothetical protein
VPIFPVRDLAQKGVLRDPSSYQLDLNAWSNGKGIRFHANKVQSAPVFRVAQDEIATAPVFCASYEPFDGYDSIFVVDDVGATSKYQAQTYSDVTASKAICQAPTMTAQGSGYTGSGSNPSTLPSVTFSPATGTGAITALGTAIVDAAGQVTGIRIDDPGWYPTGVAPTITIAAPTSGITATATCVLGPPATTDPRAFTSTELGSVLYINRPDRAPQWWNQQSTAMSALPAQECPWTCRSLRAYGDFLIALNVTKPSTFTDPYSGLTLAGGTFSNMVKWSNLTFEGQTPPDWDPDNPNSSAGENPLEQLTSPIVDGLPMKNAFIIYSETEVWSMEQTGTSSVFQFNGVFGPGSGLLAPNCVAEVDGIHYCFGPTDIYKHDGVEKVSIVDKRNRETIFRNLNVKASEACFVRYIPFMDAVLFAYQTGDTSFSFQGGDRCNAGALYDIANDTWSFIDLPNVSAMTMANMDTIFSWESVPADANWFNFGGSWYDQSNTFVKSAVAVSSTLTGKITANRLCVYDYMVSGNRSHIYVPEINTAPFVERTGIALDQLGSNLTTYKRLKRLYPLVTIYNSVPILVQIGYSNTPSGAVTWGAPISFNPETQYKVDTITGGRYLAIRFTVPTAVDFEVAGFDCDVSDGGRR